MGLTGEQKKEYQREYMRKRRSNKEGLTSEGSNIRSNDMVFQDDGSILKWDAIERNKPKLIKLITFMVNDEKAKKYLKDIRFGVYGPTLDRVGVALGIIE